MKRIWPTTYYLGWTDTEMKRERTTAARLNQEAGMLAIKLLKAAGVQKPIVLMNALLIAMQMVEQTDIREQTK